MHLDEACGSYEQSCVVITSQKSGANLRFYIALS